MDNDNFNAILQQLRSGQNPTLPIYNDGLTTSERGTSPETGESDFGLRPVNEGTEIIPPSSVK